MAVCRLLMSSLAAVMLHGACGPSTPEQTHTGGVVRPASDDERRLLRTIDRIPSDTPTRIGNIVVRAEPAYFAASGRLCRRLLLTSGTRANGRARLACKDGTSWVYVPDVLATP